MKILSGTKGYIAREYATYSRDAVDSYIGNGARHLYLNFATKDRVIRQILMEYAHADKGRRTELIKAYSDRVEELIASNEFYIKYASSYEKIPSIEVSDHESSEYLVCISSTDKEEFLSCGSVAYIDKEFYPLVKVIQKVEYGNGNKFKCIDGFLCVPKIKNFKFYVFTRGKNSSGKYYLEEVTADYANRACRREGRYVSKEELSLLIQNLREL